MHTWQNYFRLVAGYGGCSMGMVTDCVWTVCCTDRVSDWPQRFYLSGCGNGWWLYCDDDEKWCVLTRLGSMVMMMQPRNGDTVMMVTNGWWCVMVQDFWAINRWPAGPLLKRYAFPIPSLPNPPVSSLADPSASTWCQEALFADNRKQGYHILDDWYTFLWWKQLLSCLRIHIKREIILYVYWP